MPSKGLGRGLSALLGDTPAQADSGVTLRLTAIEPNPDQPRRHFDKQALEELAASIRENGLIQPLVVRPIGEGRYALIAGERRWRACRMAGLKEAPAVILEADDLRAAHLGPLEAARGYETLLSSFGLTQEEAAKRIGISRSALANTMRLLTLDSYCQKLLSEGKLSAGHARTLLALEDEALRRQAADACVEQEMSVRQLEALVKRLQALPKKGKPAKTGVDYSAELSRRLSQSLGRKITVRQGAKKGKIEIEYYGNDDLDTLVALLEGTNL